MTEQVRGVAAPDRDGIEPEPPDRDAIQPEPPLDVEEVSLFRRFFNLRTLLSFGIAVAIIVVFLMRVEINVGEIWDSIRRANLGWFLMAFVIYYATFPLRALRWQYLLVNAGLFTETGTRAPRIAGLSEIIYLGWFANTLVPAKLGDLYRAYLLKRNANVSFSGTFGTIFAERIVDMLVLFGLLLLASLTFLGQATERDAELIVLLGLAMSIVIVVGLLGFWKLGDPIGRRLPGRIRGRFAALHQGTIQSFQRLPVLGGLTVLIWLMEASRLYFIGLSLGLGIDPPVVVFVALAGSILTTVPLTPGGLALVETGITGLLTLLAGLSLAHALSMAVLDRSISYWSLVIGGLLVFLVTRKK